MITDIALTVLCMLSGLFILILIAAYFSDKYDR